jgi:hypothetical protein
MRCTDRTAGNRKFWSTFRFRGYGQRSNESRYLAALSATALVLAHWQARGAWGWIHHDNDFIEWVWSDGAMWLLVEVDKPGMKSAARILPFGRILSDSGRVDPEAGFPCNRA